MRRRRGGRERYESERIKRRAKKRGRMQGKRRTKGRSRKRRKRRTLAGGRHVPCTGRSDARGPYGVAAAGRRMDTDARKKCFLVGESRRLRLKILFLFVWKGIFAKRQEKLAQNKMPALTCMWIQGIMNAQMHIACSCAKAPPSWKRWRREPGESPGLSQ